MKVTFFWAEDVVEQKNNKMTVTGLLPDCNLLLPKDYYDEIIKNKEKDATASFALTRLALLINIKDYSRDLVVNGQFYDPTGEKHGPLTDLGKVPYIHNKSFNIIFLAQPFPFPTIGTYKIDIQIFDEHFQSELNIRVDSN